MTRTHASPLSFTRLRLLVIGLPLAALLVLWIGCDDHGRPIEFVLPDGYTGRVILVLDTKSGVDIPIQDGKYVIAVPADGSLRVKTHDPFHRWHQETWLYASGAFIQRTGLVQNPDPNLVMVRGSVAAVSSEARWMEYFVETDAQEVEDLRSHHQNPK